MYVNCCGIRRTKDFWTCGYCMEPWISPRHTVVDSCAITACPLVFYSKPRLHLCVGFNTARRRLSTARQVETSCRMKFGESRKSIRYLDLKEVQMPTTSSLTSITPHPTWAPRSSWRARQTTSPFRWCITSK